MPERCPICDTKLVPGYYCTKCERRVREDMLEAEVRMLEGAIEGWRRVVGDLKKKYEACGEQEEGEG